MNGARENLAERVRAAVATVHSWPLSQHLQGCACEQHAPGASGCPCRTCVAVREGRCPHCGRGDA